jgi:hypothetical protein
VSLAVSFECQYADWRRISLPLKATELKSAIIEAHNVLVDYAIGTSGALDFDSAFYAIREIRIEEVKVVVTIEDDEALKTVFKKVIDAHHAENAKNAEEYDRAVYERLKERFEAKE